MKYMIVLVGLSTSLMAGSGLLIMLFSNLVGSNFDKETEKEIWSFVLIAIVSSVLFVIIYN